MDEILKKADELAAMLREHPRYQSLRQAREAVNGDAAAGQDLAAYQQQAEKMQQLAAQQRPIEPEDKSKLAELEQRVTSHDNVRDLIRAQADFSELLNNLNKRLFGPIAAEEGMEEGDDEVDSGGEE